MYRGIINIRWGSIRVDFLGTHYQQIMNLLILHRRIRKITSPQTFLKNGNPIKLAPMNWNVSTVISNTIIGMYKSQFPQRIIIQFCFGPQTFDAGVVVSFQWRPLSLVQAGRQGVGGVRGAQGRCFTIQGRKGVLR